MARSSKFHTLSYIRVFRVIRRNARCSRINLIKRSISFHFRDTSPIHSAFPRDSQATLKIIWINSIFLSAACLSQQLNFNKRFATKHTKVAPCYTLNCTHPLRKDHVQLIALTPAVVPRAFRFVRFLIRSLGHRRRRLEKQTVIDVDYSLNCNSWVRKELSRAIQL